MKTIDHRNGHDIVELQSLQELHDKLKSKDGFILNDWKTHPAGQDPKRRWNGLHRADRKCLSQKSHPAVVSKEFRKIYSKSLQALEGWCTINRGGRCGADGKAVWKHCGRCLSRPDCKGRFIDGRPDFGN